MTAAAQDADDGSRPPPAGEPAAKKKRGADRQMTKDDGEGEDDSEAPTGEFKKADAETLAKRRIVKVKRPTADSKKSSNPFANALVAGATSTAAASANSSSVFGSGFGAKTEGTGFGAGAAKPFGFGTAFSGFGAAASGTTGFGSAFGSSSSTAGAATTSTLFGGGDKKEEKTTFGFATTSTSTTEAAASDKEVFPQDVSVVNGEEGDECVYEVRSKSFLLVEEDEKVEKEESDEAKPTMSVPPSSSTAPKKADSKADDDKPEEDGEKKKEEETKEDKAEETGKLAESKEEDKKEETKEETKDDKKEGEKKQQRWREMGTGPLRVLKNGGTARIVQRREASAGGMGYQLLVNAILAKESKLTRPSEKHVQLGTLSDPPASYLFKVRTAQDATELEESLQKEIDAAKSVVKD